MQSTLDIHDDRCERTLVCSAGKKCALCYIVFTRWCGQNEKDKYDRQTFPTQRSLETRDARAEMERLQWRDRDGEDRDGDGQTEMDRRR